MNRKRRISTGSQLGLVIGLASAITILIAALACFAIRAADAQLDVGYSTGVESFRALAKIEARLVEASTAAMLVVIDTDKTHVPAGIYQVESKTHEIEQLWSDYIARVADHSERTSAEKFRSAYDGLVVDGLRPITSALRVGDVRAAELAYGKLPLLVDETLGALHALGAAQLASAKGRRNDALAQASRLMLALSVAATVGAAILIVFGGWIWRGLYGELGGEPIYARHVASEIAQGNLGIEVNAAGSDAQSVVAAMTEMRDALNVMVRHIRVLTESVHAAVAQIADANIELALRTEEQATSLEQTLHEIDAFTQSVREGTDNVEQARTLAVAAADVANDSSVVVGQVVSTMQEVSSESERMLEIVSVMEGMAFQTNLLALNAAVEAARVGVQGRGFAVVAVEVRSLAQRSATSARQIRDLIHGTVSKIAAGTDRVERAGELMRDVQQANARVVDIVSEIVVISGDQRSCIERISSAVAQLNAITQNIAGLVDAGAGATESLRQRATGLVEAVGVFRLAAPRSEGESALRGQVERRPTVPLAQGSRAQAPLGAA